MSDDDPRDETGRRPRVQSGDDRALAHRARTRTPAAGVVISGEIDDPDTLDDFGGVTPIAHMISAVERDLGTPLSPDVLQVARVMYAHGRREAERTSNRILALAAQHPPEASIAAEVEKLRGRVHDVERVAADAMGGHAIHGEADRAAFRRIDERLAEVLKWQEQRAADEKELARDATKDRGKLYGKLAAAAIPGVIALIAAAVGYGASGERFDALVETVRGNSAAVRKLDAELDELRTDLLRARLRTLPGFPADPVPGD